MKESRFLEQLASVGAGGLGAADRSAASGRARLACPRACSRTWPRLFAAALALTIAGCGDGDGDTTGPETNQAPTATIEAPSPDTTADEGEEIVFRGRGEDPEDGTLGGGSLVWSSDADGELGTGTELTVADLSSGSHSVTLTATDSEGATGADQVELTVRGPFTPEADTELSGEQEFTEVEIPEGVTVTAAGDLTLRATGAVTIAGELVGDCVGIDVAAEGPLLVTGDVTNACSEGPAGDLPRVRLIGVTGLTLDSAGVVSAGDLLAGTDPDAAFETLPILAQESGSSALHPAGTSNAEDGLARCDIESGAFLKSENAPAGADGRPEGEDGRDAGDVILACGDVEFFLNRITTGFGGPGGTGESSDGTRAVGGDGGRGGDINVTATGTVTFAFSTSFTLGSGGTGGKGIAESETGDAEAAGGDGGRFGLPVVRADEGIVVKDGALDISWVAHTSGGWGVATGKKGDQGEAGGSATATGGDGGDLGVEPRTELIGDLLRGPDDAVFSITGAGNIEIQVIPQIGEGGLAVVEGGKGGDGTEERKPGGDGGNMRGTGGAGGDVFLEDNRPGSDGEYLSGRAGHGGNVIFGSEGDEEHRGQGGHGLDACEVDPAESGGPGGDGGDVRGKAGLEGTNVNDSGDRGAGEVVIVSKVGDGGDGGDGDGPGSAGSPGATTDLEILGDLIDLEPNFQPGEDGNRCDDDGGGATKIGFDYTPEGASSSEQHVGVIGADGSGFTDFGRAERGGFVGSVGWPSSDYLSFEEDPSDDEEPPRVSGVSVSSGEFRTLAEGDGAEYPAPLPDGSIAYVQTGDPSGSVVAGSRGRSGGSRSAQQEAVEEIFVMEPDGSGKTQVTDAPDLEKSRPVGGPDGRIYFIGQREDEENDVYRVERDGSGLVNLTDSPESETDVQVSPDGSRIAFRRTLEENGSFRLTLWVADADGGGETQVAPELESALDPDWSPDSGTLLFRGESTSGDWNIYRANADGSGVENLTETSERVEFNPTWAPSGEFVAYVASFTDEEGNEAQELFRMDPDGSEQTQLTDLNGRVVDVAVQP